MTFAMMSPFVSRYVKNIIVRTIATLSDSLSHFEALPPRAFAQIPQRDLFFFLFLGGDVSEDSINFFLFWAMNNEIRTDGIC